MVLLKRVRVWILRGTASLLLSVGSLLILHSPVAYATSLSGSGTIVDPYLVTDCLDLQAVTDYMMNDSFDNHGFFSMTNDIDCADTINWNSGAGFVPIGDYPNENNYRSFEGTFDGNGHTISNLYINASSGSANDNTYSGLFGTAYEAHLRNFKVVDATMMYDSSGYAYNVGGVVGLLSHSTMSQVSFSGDIEFDTTDGRAGGIWGNSDGFSTVSLVSAAGSITAHGAQIGGLGGSGYNDAISDSYSQLNLTSNLAVSVTSQVGGLVGDAQSTSVSNSYASGDVGATNSDDVVGSLDIGGIFGAALNSPSQNSFVTGSITTPVDLHGGDLHMGSIVGSQNNSSDFATSYYDQLATGVTQCSFYAPDTSCQAVNTSLDPNATYFNNTSSSPPLDQWDFTNIWQTTSTLPTIRSAPTNVRPGVPRDVTPTVESNTTMNLSWTTPISPGIGTISSYYVLYQKVGTTTWQQVDTQSSDTTYTLGNSLLSPLTASTQYNIEVFARNTHGYLSDASSLVTGTTATPGFHLITNCEQLQSIRNDLGANYELAKNIDCSMTNPSSGNFDGSGPWADGTGFVPNGYITQGVDFLPFRGILEGNNYTISDLFSDETNNPTIALQGIFGLTQNAVIQDLRITNATIINNNATSRGYVGVLIGGDLGSTVTNVQVSDALIQGSAVMMAGGVVGFEQLAAQGMSITQSSFTGTIDVLLNGSSNNGINVGGILGAGYIVGSTATISNNYSQADITVDARGAYMGGVVGFVSGTIDITDSYASGSLAETSTDPNAELAIMGGVMGYGLISDGFEQTITNSFAQVAMSSTISQSFIGGVIAGINDDNENFISGDMSSDAFDAGVAGVSTCDVNPGGPAVDCDIITGQPNYFYNNHSVSPLDAWDFDNVWKTTSTLPVFKEEALATITTISEERLHPTTPPKTSSGTPVLPVPAEIKAPTYGPLAGGTVGEAPKPIAKEGGFIGKIKELLNKIPAGVLVGFPYVAMGALGLGSLFLLIETFHQIRRLKAINVLLAKQTQIADQRDTFWHLAANYLRAPITLLMGGIELLNMPATTAKSLGAAVAKGAAVTTKKVSHSSADAITKLVTAMQVKVAGIMEQIEHSSSLQGITRPKLNAGQKVSRQLRFWVPLLCVGALVVLTNYVARDYRHLNVSVISLITQVVIFFVVAIALYWILGALGIVTGKRKQAEELLAKQTSALDSARIELISKTAEALDRDVTRLDKLLDGLSPKEAALPIMREGSTRLRHMVDSFHLLISAQNDQLDKISPDTISTKLDTVIESSVKGFQPLIESKRLTIDRSSFGSLKVPGNTAILDQVISSVLSNAIDFSPKGGVIKISESNHDGKIFLSIIDQGQGVSEDQLGHIFQPFTKADGQNALQMDHGGLGINLYLDKQIMNYLGGDVTIESTAGLGTTLTLTWPENHSAASGKLDLRSPDTEPAYLG